MRTRLWWVEAEDGQQASDTEVTMESAVDGHVIVYRLGIEIGGVRRTRTQLVLRCHEDGGITCAWGRRQEQP